METENGFRITTYKKKDLACLYCPNATARCAIRTPDAVDKTESRTV